MTRSSVAFLITNYNYSQYIIECIDSILSLRGQYKIRIIVVDDNSIDNSKDILRLYLSKYSGKTAIEPHFLRNNIGKLNIINSFIPTITEEYTVIFDADDIISEDYLEVMFANLSKTDKSLKNIDFLYSNCTLIDQRGNEIGEGKSSKFDAEMVKHHSYIPEPALCKTEALMKCLPLNGNIRVGTKHHKWKEMVSLGSIGYHVAEPLFRYRMHNRNLSGIGNKIQGDLKEKERNELLLTGYWPTV